MGIRAIRLEFARMKRRSTSGPRVRPNTPALAVILGLAIIAMLQLGCSSGRRASSATPARAETFRTAARASTSAGVRLICPTLGASRVQRTPQVAEARRVILSWKASAPADSSHAAAEGYCVYRGNKPKDPLPELVNYIPFPGTTCTDDLVENNKKYYYVVRAISDKGVTSITSNEMPVAILVSTPSSASIPASPPPPLCREAPSVQ